MITISSLPLKDIETDFAVDSSGLHDSRFVRWFDQKYGAVSQEHDWVKVHLMCGVQTNVVTAVEIKGRHAADTRALPYLVDMTAENFVVREVAADKAYGSAYNFEVIDRHGATPFIAFQVERDRLRQQAVGEDVPSLPTQTRRLPRPLPQTL